MTKTIEASFLIVKIKEDVWDVLVFGAVPILKAFSDIYHGIFVSESKFDNKPVCIMPNFENKQFAEAWKNYWIEAFSSPEKACKTCPTVSEMFEKIRIYQLENEDQ